MTDIVLDSWVAKLSDREHLVFDKGFCVALESVCEEFTEARISLLSKLHELQDEDGDDGYQKQLLARIDVLDKLEKKLKRRINVINPSVAALTEIILD